MPRLRDVPLRRMLGYEGDIKPERPDEHLARGVVSPLRGKFAFGAEDRCWAHTYEVWQRWVGIRKHVLHEPVWWLNFLLIAVPVDDVPLDLSVMDIDKLLLGQRLDDSLGRMGLDHRQCVTENEEFGRLVGFFYDSPGPAGQACGMGIAGR